MKKLWARPKHKKFLHYPQNTSCLDDFSHRSPVKDLNKYDDGYSSSLTRPYYITGKLYTCGHTIPGQFSSLVIGSTEWDLGKSLGSVFVLLSFFVYFRSFLSRWENECYGMTRMTQLDASDATVQSPIQSFFIRGPFIGRPIKHADVFLEWCTWRFNFSK